MDNNKILEMKLTKIVVSNSDLVNYLKEALKLAEAGAIWEGVIFLKGKDNVWYYRSTEIENKINLVGAIEYTKQMVLTGGKCE